MAACAALGERGRGQLGREAGVEAGLHRRRQRRSAELRERALDALLVGEFIHVR
jgi:hypothetical protein